VMIGSTVTTGCFPAIGIYVLARPGPVIYTTGMVRNFPLGSVRTSSLVVII
jgi:hypothetical protein